MELQVVPSGHVAPESRQSATQTEAKLMSAHTCPAAQVPWPVPVQLVVVQRPEVDPHVSGYEQ